MAAGIERSQVFQAVQTFEATHKRSLPSFQKPVETSWFPSISDLFRTKVYVSHKDNNLSFVELNWINKIVRWLGWHKDTVFTDAAAKGTLAKVKEYVDGILTESRMFKAVESLLPKAQTSGDIRCLREILICHQGTETNEINNAYIKEQIGACVDKMGALAFDPRFSEPFLDAAIESASKDNTIWEKIEETLKGDTNTDRGALNLALLKEIRGQSVKVPCQNLLISEDIKTAIRTEIDNLMYSKEHSRALEIGLTRTDYTRLVDMKSQHWTNLRCIQLCFLGGKEQQLKTALSEQLIENGAYKPFVLGYLRDTPSLAAKLLDHTEMSAYRQGILQGKMDAIDAALLSEINGYEIKWPPFANEAQIQKAQEILQQQRTRLGSNSLGKALVGLHAAVVGDAEVVNKVHEQAVNFQKARAEIEQTDPRKLAHNMAYDQNIEDVLLVLLMNPNLTWRVQIAGELAKPEYQVLIEARIKEDKLLEEVNSQAEYCEWIKQPGHRIGMPELVAISDITQCAVFVVQDTSHGYEIIERINFNHQVSAFIFYKDDSGHFQPMIKKNPE